MPRTLWTGYVSFGLVSVPVGLYPAIEDQSPTFNQLHVGTSNRIRYKKVDEVTGEEVETQDIVRGFDTGDGDVVLVTDEELKDAAPGKSELIEISDFVDLASIDPVFFNHGYYLAPRGKGAERAYSLLRQAMAESGKVGIATIVMRDKQHLVAIRPAEDVLILETMYFPAEIRDPRTELPTLPEETGFEGPELAAAKTLIESLTIPWEPERYENHYLQRLEALLAAKHGENVTVPKTTSAPAVNVVDLMSALEASVGRRDQTSATKKSGSKSASKADAVDLDAMTKAKLARLAGDYGIAGRSAMSKAELVDALREAGAANPKRAATA